MVAWWHGGSTDESVNDVRIGYLFSEAAQPSSSSADTPPEPLPFYREAGRVTVVTVAIELLQSRSWLPGYMT